jgi:7-cyano-7-deazaguanine synthase
MGAIILLSGGLDSTVSAYAARQQHSPELAITFDYGQRAAPREIEAALCIAADLDVRHRLIKLPWLGRLAPPAVTDPSADLAAAGDAAFWVPARNAVFLSIAAAFAEALDCEAIVCGFNAEEARTFPDNSPEFVERADALLALATRNAPRVLAPTLHLTKPEIVRLGLELQVPLHLTWSCYGAGPAHCLQCTSCRRLRAALEAAGAWESWRAQRPDPRQLSGPE